jgi:NADP-dependent 3-hydroxy acid dehydrogenase YdfG
MTSTDSRPVALVTGATGGMGVEIVRDLARTHHVIALGRDADALASLAAQTGAETRIADLLSPETLEQVVTPGERIDVLVHTAAIGEHLSVEKASVADWQRQLTTNVIAAAELTRAALPSLRAAEGTIVFIGSGAGTRPVPGSAIYAASKHALKALADTLRIDEEKHRVRVVTVAPGQTATKMSGELTEEKLARYIKPTSVAATVRFVIDSPADVHLTDIAVRPRQEIARL